MERLSAEAPKKEGKLLGQKLAVSYQRVSTPAQTEEDKSGLGRQKQARDQWLAANPEYKLIDTVEVAISGRKKNRFEWFINDREKQQIALALEVVEGFEHTVVPPRHTGRPVAARFSAGEWAG